MTVERARQVLKEWADDKTDSQIQELILFLQKLVWLQRRYESEQDMKKPRT